MIPVDTLVAILGAVIGAALFGARPRRVIRATARIILPLLLPASVSQEPRSRV